MTLTAPFTTEAAANAVVSRATGLLSRPDSKPLPPQNRSMARSSKTNTKSSAKSSATTGFGVKLWQTADDKQRLGGLLSSRGTA